MIDKKRAEINKQVTDFIQERKGKYISYHHWMSGGTVEVYPISSFFEDDGKGVQIEIQMGDCDARNWRGFESVLKKRFPCVESAYYCKYDGSCPDVYRVNLHIE